jgi:hypothetical protein
MVSYQLLTSLYAARNLSLIVDPPKAYLVGAPQAAIPQKPVPVSPSNVSVVYATLSPQSTSVNPSAPVSPGSTDTAQALKNLSDLHNSGALTDEEYAQAKKKYLG